MCGRFAQFWPLDRWNEMGPIDWHVPDGFHPHYNLSPTMEALSIVCDHRGALIGGMMRWGFKQGKTPLINARWETLTERPTFSRLLERRRCLIPINGYFEWDHVSHQPYYFSHPCKERSLMVAALYQPSDHGAAFCLITRRALSTIDAIHPRMPLVLKREHAHRWLSSAFDYRSVRDEWLSEESVLTVTRVSTRVNSSQNDSADVIQAFP